MHLDNKRLQSIQRYKALIQNKIDHETDPVELETWSIILQEYRKEEQTILERLDVKRWYPNSVKDAYTGNNATMTTNIAYICPRSLYKNTTKNTEELLW